MHPALRFLDHRPWPLPAGDWKWRQSWLELAFLHYRVSVEEIGKLLPSGVELQEFDGSAWVGLVPFRMAGVMRRPFPPFPPFNSFPELNLRTYVEVDGKPGVWFFSLDADCWPVVWGGRRWYKLPYFSAEMEHRQDDGWCRFSSVRRGGDVRFKACFRPLGEPFSARPGSFEHWATERYCLYSHSERSGISRVEVHHAPWPLQEAEVEIEECDILSAAGISPIGSAPICHCSGGVAVVSYAKEVVG